ncbi:MAG: SUMF1/EgtB/PvdO family nonheme iron enzyme [Deltaproteobacteria bacterium]|nr:SUMF1/EgtB/PvdO family nonheme iron enzyme [Deltaproteobacteria bacterium]
MTLLGPGTKLTNSLTLVRILDEGGMGTVWLAEHRSLATEVAVKVMHMELAQRHPSLVERFTTEARTAAKIRHPHIVQVLDHGMTEDGVPWLSMERLEGATLRTVIAETGRLGPTFARRLIEQTASGLAAAHAAGVIHRDLKPENLFVTEVDGRPFVKVLDFGIAKLTEKLNRQTRVGSVFGTTAYMSPEQLKSTRDVDAQADMWALAVVAYELLTGRLPFDGETPSAIAIAVATGEFSPPSRLAPDLGSGIDAFFAQAFTKHPSERFGSAKALAKAFSASFDEVLEVAPARASRVPRTQFDVPAPDSLARSRRDSARPSSGVALSSSKPGAARSSSHRTELASPSASWPEEPSVDDAEQDLAPPTRARTRPRSAVGYAVLAVCGVALALWATASTEGERSATPAPASAVATSQAARKPSCPTGMGLVPGGVFRMGSESGDENERPVRAVQVDVFCLDMTEVTTAEYQACVERGRCSKAGTTVRPDPAWGLSKSEMERASRNCNADRPERGRHPINCVDWHQAGDYCVTSGKRLPTEEEWEFAARGGAEARLYPWGAEPPGPTHVNGCGRECVAYYARSGANVNALHPANDGFETTAPVASFPAGAGRWGHFDLAGNVWEWTSSGFSESYASERSTEKRVDRGGGWDSDTPSGVRGAIRGSDAAERRDESLGFRCAARVLP